MDRTINIAIGDKGEIQNVDFAAWIMNEIEGKQFTRKDVAATHAILIQKGYERWAPINAAIIKRWSPAGLRWIKEQAWKMARAA